MVEIASGVQLPITPGAKARRASAPVRMIGLRTAVLAGECRPPRSLIPASDPVFQQFRGDVPASVKDAQDQHPFDVDRKSNADGAPITNNPQPRHDFDPLRAALWKSRQGQAMVANARNKIPRNHRRRTFGYVVLELSELGFRLGMEDNPILHPLFLSRLLRAMTHFQP